MAQKKELVMEVDTLTQYLVKKSSEDFRALLPANITATQFIILKVIKEKGQCKGADIAQMLCFSPAAATNMVDRLCKNDWIMRVRSKKDRRIVWLKLTATGEELLKEIEIKRQEVLLKNFAGVNKEELSFLKTILLKMLNK